MNAVQQEEVVKGVRLDLAPADPGGSTSWPRNAG
jgi:hypothetical protein